MFDRCKDVHTWSFSSISLCIYLNCSSPNSIYPESLALICFTICSIVAIIVLFLAVPKILMRDVVITNGILLINIISISIVTLVYLSMISGSKLYLFIVKCSCVVCAVSHFGEPR